MAVAQISNPVRPDPHQRRIAIGIDSTTIRSWPAVRNGVAECLPAIRDG